MVEVFSRKTYYGIVSYRRNNPTVKVDFRF